MAFNNVLEGSWIKVYQANRKEPFGSWSNWEIYTLPSVKYVVAAYVVSPRSNSTVIPLSIQARGVDVSNLHLFSKVIIDPLHHDAAWFVARDVFWEWRWHEAYGENFPRA